MRVDIHVRGRFPVRREAVRAVFSSIAKILPRYRNAAVSVAFLSSAAVRTLNRRYRGKNRATNVLSFPEGPARLPNVEGSYVGEIIISYPRARAEARRDGIRIRRRLSLLLVHGFLHLVGFDHHTDSAEREMNKIQERIQGEWLRR
ncbi:MAG: rRNA maturation RNase YbeY [Patescibacteria group bacterium]|nr:rRNA maturation RNase YbeY [Patescibacteria group bacterium]MDD5715705.1 rRNA maturation RNase YbeY [Patescibacteria group bacterium]